MSLKYEPASEPLHISVKYLLAALGGHAVGDAHGGDAPRLRADDVDLHHCEDVSKCAQHVLGRQRVCKKRVRKSARV